MEISRRDFLRFSVAAGTATAAIWAPTSGCIKRRSNQARSGQLYGTVAATYGIATHPNTLGEIR
jgi:TAT (twin-arginine translocation) pathway signal sequence